MFNAIGRIVVFFALLVFFMGCVIGGLFWWTATNVPHGLTSPEQIKQFAFTSRDHFFIAYYPFAIASTILVSALIAFKPRPLTFVIAGAIAAVFFLMAPSNVRSFLSREHDLHPEYYSSRTIPLPSPDLPPAPAPVAGPPELAPPGVFYLLTTAHVETKDGITGLPPGTRVTLVQRGIYLTPAGKLHLDETQLTNDLAKARNALAYDHNAQAALHATTITVDTVLAHGTRKVPVQINGVLTRNFVVDSGATTVAVPSGVVTELMESGTLKEGDFLPGYMLVTIADGSKSKRKRFILHSIRVGEITVSNVEAVDAGPNGALLLGMTFLAKAKAMYDTEKGKLIFSR
jgi:predicted aspartyl protease